MNLSFTTLCRFDRRTEIYRKHHLRMVEEVADWTLFEIEAREARIAAWAKTRWTDI